MNAKRLVVGVAVAGLSSAVAAAQQPPAFLPVPNGPGAFPPVYAPAPPPPNAVGIAPRPAMPTQNTLWSYLGVSGDQREYRRRQQLNTPLGQMRSNIRQPLTRLSGGLIPPFAPATPSLAQLMDPGPVGAASKVKFDRAGAEERKKAVEYLGTVNCHYWPEAEDALIGALRADRNECVRLAAAEVLGRGCCCTKKTIKALSIAADGTDCDGNPSELSPQVRAAAQAALEKCLCCFVEMESSCPDRKDCDKKPLPPPLPQPPLVPAPLPKGKEETGPMKQEGSAAVPGPYAASKDYYDKVAKLTSAAVIADARKAMTVTIPVSRPGSEPNQFDLEAGGLPGPFSASAYSPKPVSMLDWFVRGNPGPGARPVQQAAALVPVVHTGGFASTPPAVVPAVTAYPAPRMTFTQPTPAPQKVATGSTPTPAPAPTATRVPAAVAPAAIPAAAPAPAPTATRVPAPVAPGAIPATATAVAPVAFPTAVVPVPGPKVTPAVEAPRADGRPGSRPTKVVRMLKEPVPVADLVAAIDQLTPEDVKSCPEVGAELVAGGAQSWAPQSVRLAAAKALVRCKVGTPAAAAALRSLATADPDAGVREAARAGVR